ncbi:hypothetical protein A5640_18395, partial [Mycobacterium asiaticum]
HPPTHRDRRRTELLVRIHATAYQLFAQHGYAAVTTDDIAATVGISISTYYRHAPNKEHLLTAPIQQAIAEITTTYNTRPHTETAAASLIHLLADTLGKTADGHSQHWKQALQSAPHLLNSSTLLSDNQTRQLTTMVATRMNTDPTSDIRPTLLIHTALSTAQTALNRPRFLAHFLCWEGWRDADQVRREHQGQGGATGPRTPRRLRLEWAAMCAISARLGMAAETLRKWVRQTEVDAGEAAGVSSEEKRELRELRRKCKELESTIEILKAATSFFARECDPLHR